MTEKFQITEEVSIYKGALKLLKHYDEVYQQYKELETKEFKAEEIPEPQDKPIPSRPVANDKLFQSHKTMCNVLAFIVLAGITALFCFYLVPNGIYTPQYKLRIADYYLTEIHIAFVATFIVCLIFNNIAINRLKKNVVKHSTDIEHWVDEKLAIQNDNAMNREIYEARIAEEEKETNELKKANELKMQALSTTLKNIQKDYMKNYAPKVPNSLATVEGLERKIAELEEKMKEPLIQSNNTQPVFTSPFPQIDDLEEKPTVSTSPVELVSDEKE